VSGEAFNKRVAGDLKFRAMHATNEVVPYGGIGFEIKGELR
jgi:hypothetical protein